MKRTTQIATRGVFSLGILATLVFGATQAVASPTGARAEATCVGRDCDQICRLGGARFGRCQVDDETGEPFCMCFYG